MCRSCYVKYFLVQVIAMQEIATKWVEDISGQYEYYAEKTGGGKTYIAAKSACEKVGSVLASIRSEATQKLVQNLIPVTQVTPQVNHLRRFWIGAHRANGSSPWMWMDGSLLNYTNWEKDEESQKSAMPENCALIFNTFDYKWFSNHCDRDRFGYVCERPAGGGECLKLFTFKQFYFCTYKYLNCLKKITATCGAYEKFATTFSWEAADFLYALLIVDSGN